MGTVLFATKDHASKPAIPLALELQKNGHVVQVVCEGLSSALWYDAGFLPHFVGTLNIDNEPFTLNAKKVLERLNPDVVIACEGNPINLEQEFGLAANELGIPLVFLEDFWNGFRRNKAKPQIVLTIDEYAARLACDALPNAKVVCVGSGQSITRIPPSAALSEQLMVLKAKREIAVLYIGGETTEDLTLMIECMKKTQGFVIPRFHPKHKDFKLPDGRTREACWKEMLLMLGERVVWFDTEPLLQLISGVDVVCSGLSLSLVEAVSCGTPTVVLQTREVSHLLHRITGLSVFPLVPLGLAHALERPFDLASFVGKERVDPTKVILPFNAEKAYQTLEPYLPKNLSVL